MNKIYFEIIKSKVLTFCLFTLSTFILFNYQSFAVESQKTVTDKRQFLTSHSIVESQEIDLFHIYKEKSSYSSSESEEDSFFDKQKERLLNYIFSIKGEDNDPHLKEKKNLLKYLSSVESKRTGLYQSFTNSAHYIEDIFSNPPIYMKMPQGYLDDQSFTYDQALAIIALVHTGQFQKARYLLQIFAENFETEKNGRKGLFNSYLLSNFDYFIPTKKGTQNLLCIGIDGDRMHVGPNTWMGIACLQYYAHTGSPEFLPFALKIFQWARSLNHYAMPDGTPGGVCMGYG